LILYLDASALVKRYVEEEGSDAVLDAMDPESNWVMCRIGYVETAGAVARGGQLEDLERLRRDWSLVDIVEVSQALVERAARLAASRGLRALDALHLAAALSIPTGNVLFATWDTRLHRAARAQGLRTLPATLG
jgi:predicted nucleic acid-binding protein